MGCRNSLLNCPGLKPGVSSSLTCSAMYEEMILAKVTSVRGVEYFAIDEDTLENMYDSSSAMQYIPGGPGYEEKQFQVEKLGIVKVKTNR